VSVLCSACVDRQRVDIHAVSKHAGAVWTLGQKQRLGDSLFTASRRIFDQQIDGNVAKRRLQQHGHDVCELRGR
jgi:hypothetical protein